MNISGQSAPPPGRAGLTVVLCGLVALVWSAAMWPASALAQPVGAGRLLVVSKTETTLYVIDPITLTILGKVPAGEDPHEVAVSADGRIAYISNYGAGRGRRGLSTFTAGDIVDFKPLPSIDLGVIRGPHGMVQSGGKIYFTAQVNKVIGRYDPAAGKIDLLLGGGQNGTHLVAVSADSGRLFTSNIQSGTVSVIELATKPEGRYIVAPEDDWRVSSIRVGLPADGFEGFDVAPDGRELWTAAPAGRIAVVDTVDKSVVTTIESAHITGANRLKFTPDGKQVLVSRLQALPAGDEGGNVVVFDVATRKEVKQIKTGGGVGGILMQPDGMRAYAASSTEVVVIDLKSLAIVGRIPMAQPDGMAWTTVPVIGSVR